MSDLNFSDFKDVHWKVQDSTEDSLLFYKLNSGGEEKFRELIKNTKFKICIVSDPKLNQIENNIIGTTMDEWLSLREQALNHFYPISLETKFIGVTGTNGKTTTADLVRQLCILNDKPVRTIGTLGVYENDSKISDFSLTTPDYIDMRKSISNFSGIVCMEMSSHALAQKRFGSLRFKGIGWTSFSQDHLDYHKTMEEYFNAKLELFHYLDGDLFIPNTQESIYSKVTQKNKKLSQNIKAEGDFFEAIYNQENLGLAVSLLESCGVKVEKLAPLNPPPGRFNIFEFNESKIVVDFAHSPGGIESITGSIKEAFSDFELVTLFGCGGDRDRSKRPLMGKAASLHSSFLFLTSDNPRSENPEQIIEDIVPGVTRPYEKIVDRAQAIEKAVKYISERKAILLIAGKGHENYIEIKGIKKPYSDIETVRKNINDQAR